METIAIPFPKDLYNLIVLRSGGNLDPVQLAIDQVEGFIDANRNDESFWTPEGLEAFEQEAAPAEADVGDPSTGHQWGPLLLPNGTDLRMKYRGRMHYAQIRFDMVHRGSAVHVHLTVGEERRGWHLSQRMA